MNKESIAEFIDAIANDNEEAVVESGKILTLGKVREKMGYLNEQSLTEVGEVQIKNNDVFVSGKKVGTVNIDSDDAVVEFTDNEGEAKTFDDTESLHRYLNGLNESNYYDEKNQNSYEARKAKYEKDKADRMKVVKNSNAGDGEVGDYTKKDPRGSEHKDDRMDNPKKHDHGHDDPSGLNQKSKKSDGSGSLPEDKKHSLKDKLHKDDIKDSPKGHDHGHDDESGVVPPSDKKNAKSGGNPPDKTHDLKGSKHKDDRMENPKKHDHGHDSSTSKEKVEK